MPASTTPDTSPFACGQVLTPIVIVVILAVAVAVAVDLVCGAVRRALACWPPSTPGAWAGALLLAAVERT